MALGSLPPWLNVSPHDFVQAASSGATLGHAIADSTMRAWEEQARMRMQSGEFQQSQELDQQRLAQQQQQQAFENMIQQTNLNQQMQDKARKIAAQQEFSRATAAGEDPAKALLRLAPSLGESLTGAAQLYKASNLQPKPTLPESPLGKLMLDKQRASAAGADKSTLDAYDAAIAEASTNKGTRVYMGQDDQGRPVFQMATGGAAPIGNPTVATQSMAQGKELQYQNATEMLNWLEKNVKPEHLGVAGNVGEFAVDKTLAQLFPQVANKERIGVRSTLDMIQGLAREIVDSPSGRFSQQERDAVLGALPSTGFAESYPNTIARIERAKQVLSGRGKVYSTQLGQPAPVWSLSKEEIKDRYQRGKLSGLKPEDPKFKAAGFLSIDDATDALQRFH